MMQHKHCLILERAFPAEISGHTSTLLDCHVRTAHYAHSKMSRIPFRSIIDGERSGSLGYFPNSRQSTVDPVATP
jgi:hypothetical protein